MKTKAFKLAGLIILFYLFSASAWCGEKNTGIGVIIGEPTGFSGKVWWNNSVAFDGGVAWSFVNHPSFHIHSDVLWHNWKVLDDAFEVDDSARFPLYFGIGGRIKAGDDTRVGIRFVVGGSYIFEYSPFDIFCEIVPIMDFAPETELSFNAAFGARFWF
jgi:hypothetical protein